MRVSHVDSDHLDLESCFISYSAISSHVLLVSRPKARESKAMYVFTLLLAHLVDFDDVSALIAGLWEAAICTAVNRSHLTRIRVRSFE